MRFRRDLERRARGGRALDEQVRRLERHQRRYGDVPAGFGHRKRRDGVRAFARDAQRLPAGRQDLQTRSGAEQPRCEVRTRLHQVLAIVENDEEAALRDELFQRLDNRAPCLLDDAEHRRNRLRNESRIAQRRELDEPDSIRVFVENVGRDLQRQTGLSEAAAAEQRHEAGARNERFDLLELTAPADEGRRPAAAGRRGQRFERYATRESRCEASGWTTMVHARRSREIVGEARAARGRAA